MVQCITFELTENLEDKAWEQALSCLPDGAELLQSGLWRKIALAEKRIVRRLAWQKKGVPVVLAQILESSRAGFKFWYLPPVNLIAPLAFAYSVDFFSRCRD